MNFHWIIKFDNGNEMGGSLKAKTFEEARQAVQKIVDDVEANLRYKVVEFSIRQGKLVVNYFED